MIEKIMKAVKSGNKKRGRNITIGAVVGMLLSCTVAMGEDVSGLEITKESDGSITFTPSIDKDIYPENTWDEASKTYTNNTVISVTVNSADGEAYGLKLSGNLSDLSLINNGSIVGTTNEGYGKGYGIYIEGSASTGTLKNNGSIAGTANEDYGNGSGIYIEGSASIGTLTNYGSIAGTSSNAYGSGIHIGYNAEITGTLTNNGYITGTSSKGYGYGIYIDGSGSIGTLTNDGSIAGTTNEGYGSGIHIIYDAEITGTLTNNGSITGTSSSEGGSSGSGIYNEGAITELENNGSIVGTATNRCGYGIYHISGTITKLANNGTIAGTMLGTSTDIESSGIYINSDEIETLTNTGVIYGKYNAIYKGDSGTISNANNYGLLVSGDISQNVVYKLVEIVDHDDTSGDDNKIRNYGLAFTADSSSGKYIGVGSEKGSTVDYHNSFGKIHQNVSIDGGSYDIINVDAKVNDTNVITDWKSLTLEEGKLTYYDSEEGSDKGESISPDKKYILNGIEDTLKVSGENNELNNSVVNAYKSAVVMDKGASTLTLDNTVVNGGIADGSTTVNITGEGNNFTAKGNSIINTGDEGTAITVDGDKNTVTLEGNTIVNGKMSASGEKNTLNLYGKQNMKRSSDNKSMNIFHDIEGFGRIQIENNVTFFEDVKVTGVDRININNGGTLSLRLKAGEAPGAKATHALSAENIGLLIAGKEEEDSENAGTLNFITNGMGKGTVIDMGGIELENVYLRANSIVYMMEVVEKPESDANVGDIRLDVGTSLADIYNERKITSDPYSDADTPLLPDETLYNSLNKIYQSSVADDDNVDAVTGMIGSSSDEEQWRKLLSFLGGIYTESPYSYSSELSRRSIGMFRDIVTENEFRPNLNNWLIMGGLTHADGGTKDTYYGQNYYEIDNGSSSTSADMKLTGAYMLAKYGYSENLSLGVTLGGNKSEAEMSMSKVKGNSGYLGAFAENYRGNLTLKAGAGVQYSEYDADRSTLGGHSYSDKYSDMTYDIYLNGRYSHQVGDNLFLEPYATLSYTYVDQDGANEGSKVLAIETDSKSFDYTVGKVGIDLKKVILHEKGKSTLSAGVSYTKIFDGADEEHITGRFKGGSDFDILVAHKNEHSIGLNAKYALELESGIIFDVKGTYSVERDSHNGSGKNKTKGEWIVGAGVGYKF